MRPSLYARFQPFHVQRTPWLLLRELYPADREAVFLHPDDPALHTFLLREPAENLVGADQFLQNVIQKASSGDGIHWCLDPADQQDCLIGHLGIWQIFSGHCRGVLGFILNREYHGKGYMSEALSAGINYGFEESGLHTLMADVTIGNPLSVRLLQRYSFVQEGHLKEDCRKDGVFVDMLICGRINMLTQGEKNNRMLFGREGCILQPAALNAGDQLKYSFIRSKKLLSPLPGLGLKFSESRSFSSAFFSSDVSCCGVHTLMFTSKSPRE